MPKIKKKKQTRQGKVNDRFGGRTITTIFSKTRAILG